MNDLIRLFRSIGLGDLAYTEPSAAALGALLGANDGLSRSTISPTLAVLGQNQGQPGDPAKLLSNRDIPLNGFMLQLLQTLGTDFIQFLQAQVLIDGTSGAGVVPTFGMNDQTGPQQFEITIDSLGTHFTFASGFGFTWSNIGGFEFSPDLSARCDFAGGFGGPLPTFIAPAGPGANPIGAGCVIDTSGSAESFTLDPIAMKDRFFWVKKKGTDINSISITAASGSFFGSTGAVNPYVFSGPGEAIQLGSDGTNFYVL